MALRPVSELGLADATDVEPAGHDRPSVPLRPAAERPRSTRRSPSRTPTNGTAAGKERKTAGPEANVAASQEGSDRAISAPSAMRPEAMRPEVPLADEATTFLQIMVPGELQERLADLSHLLAADHRKLRHHKTILGALLWRYVEPDDPERLRQLGAMLDVYLETDLSEAPAEIKVGAHVPFSLKYKLDGAALALRRTRRAASAKTLLSALIWWYVEAAKAQELLELLVAYYEASRPKPLPLGSTLPPQDEGEIATRSVAASSIGAIS
jgi:hypothetical protein